LHGRVLLGKYFEWSLQLIRHTAKKIVQRLLKKCERKTCLSKLISMQRLIVFLSGTILVKAIKTNHS